ncbi:ferroxidase fet3, partial [Cladochytrium tenue]
MRRQRLASVVVAAAVTATFAEASAAFRSDGSGSGGGGGGNGGGGGSSSSSASSSTTTTVSSPFAVATQRGQSSPVRLDWSVGWIDAVSPDGGPPRRAIGVNGAWPIEPVIVMSGNPLLINVYNNLDVPTAVRAHGLHQPGLPIYDGTPMVSQ